MMCILYGPGAPTSYGVPSCATACATRTVNRYVRAVAAGLNRAHHLGHVGNPGSGRMQAPERRKESETAVFLTPAQPRSLCFAAGIIRRPAEGACRGRSLRFRWRAPEAIAPE